MAIERNMVLECGKKVMYDILIMLKRMYQNVIVDF